MSAHTVRHIEAQSFSLRRGADLGLVVLLLFFTALVPAGTAGAEEERWELPEERTVFAKVFDYGDGSQAVHVGLEPLHYGDPGSGELLEIDPTLTFEDGWSNETNSFPTFLPPLLGDGSALRLGPELAVTWRPGRLSARLINGLELELDDPALSWGQPSEERSNAVVYRDLYPGLDLLVAVRRGAVDLELVLRDWLLPVEPEQVAQLFVEAEVEIPAELLERVEERAQFGEPLEEIPLYLGRAGDEHVIAVMADPGLPAPHLEEHAAALVFDSQGQTAPAPAEWLSTLGEWLASGRIRYGVDFSRFSGHLEEEGGVGVADAALMAPFKLTSADRMDSQRYFAFPKQGRVAVTISRRETANGPRYPYRLNRIEAGLGDGRIHRAVMVFAGTGDLQQKMQQMGSWEIQEMSLGTLDVHYLPPNGVVDIEADTVVAGSVASQMLPDGGVPLRASDSILDAPYNQTTRPIPGGTLQTGTWDYLAGAGFSSRTIGGKVFSFGPLSNPAPASSTPRAALDLAGMLKKNWPNFYLGLALPQETTTCIPCTDAHPNPAVQALNGEYRVGAGFYDLRLEVRLRNTVSHTATVFATSVGGHNDQLYPGEALEWDLELTALSAGASGVELTTQSWDPLDGVSFTFHDPANPATALNSAQLSALGDTVRVRATWNRARPDLYGKTQDLLLDARLAPSGRLASGEVKIPIKLRAPEGQPSFSSIYPVFDDNVSVPMGLAWVQLPSQVRGAVLGEARLRHQSGPTASLQQGVHWDLWSSASPGNDGEVVIYPDQFRPGMYTVELDPCLLPDGMPAPLHCGSAQSLSFEIRAASTPSTPKPVIDLVAPWSVDDPSGGNVTVSVHGSDLGGGSSGTTVSIPQVVSNAGPAAGSSASQVDVAVSLSGGSVCGPRQLSLTTAGGTATATFNVTKPFAGSPNHWVTEAEGAELNGIKAQSLSGASGGQVVAIAAAGAPGNLKLRFQVPATSSSYQLYAVYGSPEPNASRADLTIREAGNTVSYFKIALPMVPAGKTALRVLYDATQSSPPTLLTLEAGKTYELEIASRAGQRYPLFDLLVLSDGSLPPTLNELCL